MEQAAATRRPKLNEAERVIGPLLEEGRSGDPRAHRLRSDWRGFMREAFELTREQEGEFAALSREEAQKIQGAFMTALEHGGEIKLRVEEPAELEIRVKETPAESGEDPAEPSFRREDRTIGGTIFHCHTAKKLRDWKCHWGPVEEPPGPPPADPPTGPFDPT
jgi:hypothetical protein